MKTIKLLLVGAAIWAFIAGAFAIFDVIDAYIIAASRGWAG